MAKVKFILGPRTLLTETVEDGQAITTWPSFDINGYTTGG